MLVNRKQKVTNTLSYRSLCIFKKPKSAIKELLKNTNQYLLGIKETHGLCP